MNKMFLSLFTSCNFRIIDREIYIHCYSSNIPTFIYIIYIYFNTQIMAYVRFEQQIVNN